MAIKRSRKVAYDAGQSSLNSPMMDLSKNSFPQGYKLDVVFTSNTEQTFSPRAQWIISIPQLSNDNHGFPLWTVNSLNKIYTDEVADVYFFYKQTTI